MVKLLIINELLLNTETVFPLAIIVNYIFVHSVANRCMIYTAIKVRYITQAYVIMIYIIDFIFCTIKQIGHVPRSLQSIRSCSTLIYYTVTTLSVTFTYFHVHSIIRHAIVRRFMRILTARPRFNARPCTSDQNFLTITI